MATAASAQDAREILGPADNPDAEWARGPHPLQEFHDNVSVSLRPELVGRHPRVMVTESGLEELRRRAHGTHRDLWQQALANLHVLQETPPPAPAQERRVQNRVGIGIAEAAFAYKIEGDPVYLEAARTYMQAALSYDVWGYIYNKPDVDLAAGHLLYGLGLGYDLLYHDLEEEERAAYRDKLIRQARILYEYYELKPGRSYSYSQNHVFIPMAGLAVTAYALYDEIEEADDWARLARTLYERVLDTYSADGYYYEGIEYWVFAMPWMFQFMEAHAHATGEDLWDRPGFRNMHLYVAHSMLPNGHDIFDFGDAFEGALTRARVGDDHGRTHPEGKLHSNYNLLYRLASRFQDREIQSVANWLRDLGHVTWFDYLTILWYDENLDGGSIDDVTPWHYFPDHGVVFWRTDWSSDATAVAFKSGPPEGHTTRVHIEQFPDWHLAMGHAHPDANSFILYADGEYLSGDTGWTGLPMTAHHNTMLVDGMGQAREGEGHDVFHGVPYSRLDSIRIENVILSADSLYVIGNAASAYEPELGVVQYERHFRLRRGGDVHITDYVATREPRTISLLVHSDDEFAQTGERWASGKMGVSAKASQPLRSSVEPNDVIAPGPPGSVDQGERQQRGWRLNISTAEPGTRLEIQTTLHLAGDE